MSYNKKLLQEILDRVKKPGRDRTPNNKEKKPIVSSRGQWDHPGQRTIVPTPDGRITMKPDPKTGRAINYPVWGQDETGYGQMMYPGQDYQFPGQMVDEQPIMQNGGWLPQYQRKGQVGDATANKTFVPLTNDEIRANQIAKIARQAQKNQTAIADRTGTPTKLRKQLYDERLRAERFETLVSAADVVTDLMQLGNFIPHPLAQVIGKAGNYLGAGVDAFQVGTETRKGNYGSAATNIGSTLLPYHMGKKGYRRDMWNTDPGSLAESIAKKGSRNGSYIHLTAPARLPNNPVINKGVNFNRGLLGTLAAETLYDSYARGGQYVGNLPKAQMGTMVTPLDFSKPLGTLQGASDVMSAPARTATYLLTGKYQDPSQALGINNPWGAFAADMFLDPMNIVGAGVASKIAKGKIAGKTIRSVGKKAKPNFKSEIDWSKWNKEIPENKALTQEYNTIEQQAKVNGTWMKNPDGSAFRGTPEQFVQQNSENFKRAFGNSKLINSDGSIEPVVHSTDANFNTFDKDFFGSTDEGYHGKGFYLSPIQRKGFEPNEFYKRPYKWIDDKTVQGTHNYGKNKMMLYANPDNIVGSFPVKPYTEIIVDLNKPYNIKSATGNNGMFDMTNPNIYKALVPTVMAAGAVQQKKQGGETIDPPIKLAFQSINERNAYKKRLKSVAEKALSQSDNSYLLKGTSYHNIESGNNCINGVCGLNIEAGMTFNKPSDNDRYLSGEKFAQAVAKGKEDYYKASGNFQVGDIMQYRHRSNPNSHNKIIYDVVEDDDGNKIYKVIHNSGDTKMKSQDFTEEELKNIRTEGEKGYDYVDFYRPGHSIDKPALENERATRNMSPQAIAAFNERKRMSDYEVGMDPNYTYSIREDSPYAKDIPEGMNKFVGFANNKKNIDYLVKKLGVPKSMVHDELLNTFGELGQENKWEDRTFGGRGYVENTVEKIFKPKSMSIGPGQIKFNQVPEDLKKMFGIKKAKDLFDWDKVMPLMTALNIRNRQYLERKAERGQLGDYLTGEQNLNASNIKYGLGRFTPYMYRGMMDKPIQKLRNEAEKEISTSSMSEEDREAAIQEYINDRFVEKARFLGEGSYARKVKDNIDQNLQRVMPEPDIRGTVLPNIKIMGKNFKSGGEMIRRADGSYSRRGLWDNIRANKGSGKKPTKEMLKQERNIKAKEMKNGGTNNPGFYALPEYVQANILANMGYGGYYNPMFADGGEPNEEMTFDEITMLQNRMNKLRQFVGGGGMEEMNNGGYIGYDGRRHISNTPTWSGNAGYQNGGQMLYAQEGLSIPKQEEFSDYESYAQAMDEYHRNYADVAASMEEERAMQQMMQQDAQQDALSTSMPRMRANSPKSINYQGPSVMDMMTSLNKASDYNSRKQLASELGIGNYRGTDDQNIEMMNLVRNNPSVLDNYKTSKKVTTPKKPKNEVPVYTEESDLPEIVIQGRPKQSNPRMFAPDFFENQKKNYSVNNLKVGSNEYNTTTNYRNSANNLIYPVAGSLTALLAGTGLSAMDLIGVDYEKLANNKSFSPAMKAKLTKGRNALIKAAMEQTGKSAVEAINEFKKSPKRLQNILKNLDAMEIPGNIYQMRPGTAMRDLEALRMAQESAAEQVLMNDMQTKKMLAESAEENKAFRNATARKGAATRAANKVSTSGKPIAAAAQEVKPWYNALREGYAAARATPLLKLLRKQEGGEQDSMTEDILEFVDPTGVLSYDDVYRSWNNPNTPLWEKALTTATAFPLVGKFAKAAKAVNTVSKMRKGLNVAGKVITPVAQMDKYINPVSQFVGKVTASGLQNAPKSVKAAAQFGSLSNQSGRFWNGADMLMGYKQSGGPVTGDEIDVTPEQLEMLRAQGYQFEMI